MFRQVPESELVHQALGKTLLYGEGVVLGLFVLSVIVDPQAITRNGIIFVYLIEGNVLGLVVFLFRGLGIVKHRIVLKLVLYALLQFLDGQLYKLDGLYLKRR